MNLLIFEYISGGGYTDRNLSGSILCEAYGMASTLISDLKEAGHNVITLMDSRVMNFNPPNRADKIISVSSPREADEKLKKLSGLVDFIYVIAPESGHVLQNLLENIENSGGKTLNCEIDAVKRVSNKMTTNEALKKLNLKVPETVLLDVHEKTGKIEDSIKGLEYPLVFKPLEGVSCDGLSVIKDKGDIDSAVRKVAQESMVEKFVAQKFVSGEAASVSVISSGSKAYAVSLNRQFVTLASPDGESRYYGGIVPFSHRMEKEALRAAERAVEGIGGLKGYVGVDMVLTEAGPVIMEVNPRLTVSYVGLAKTVNFNPAEAVIETVTEQVLPKTVQKRGCSFFSKVEVPSSRQVIAETYKLKDVVSPPFPIEEDKNTFALIVASSTSLEAAQSEFCRSKKQLLSLYGE